MRDHELANVGEAANLIADKPDRFARLLGLRQLDIVLVGNTEIVAVLSQNPDSVHAALTKRHTARNDGAGLRLQGLR